MITCPACQAPLQENSPACPSPNCQLSLERVDRALGPVPQISPGLSDTVSLLSSKKKKSINAAIHAFERDLSPYYLHVVIRNFDPKYNLSLQLFWLFNKAGLSPVEHKLADNYDLMLGLDPVGNRLGLMIGYGLEPFISKETISTLLEEAAPSLEKNNPEEAILTALKSLRTLLQTASNSAKTTLGL